MIDPLQHCITCEKSNFYTFIKLLLEAKKHLYSVDMNKEGTQVTIWYFNPKKI